MEKLTDNEIIKALECCVTYEFCTGCPLVDNCPSSYSLLKSALDLINRQKAEIERQREYIELLDIEHEAIKVSAIKEFAERLKEKSSHIIDFDMRVINYVDVDDIDNLLKEMEGEK